MSESVTEDEYLDSIEKLAKDLVEERKRNERLQLAIENVRTIVEVVKIRKEYRDEILNCLPKQEEELQCGVSSVESVQLLWD